MSRATNLEKVRQLRAMSRHEKTSIGSLAFPSVADGACANTVLGHNLRSALKGELVKALIFDTETTGMVQFRKPPEDPSQPDLIQLGMLLVDTEDWKPRARHSFLVQLNEGVRIEPGAREAHGISEEDCARYGIVPMVACSLFNQACLQADIIVAHNLAFDVSIMKTALHRLGKKPHRMDGRQSVCTKEYSTDVLKLPGKYGYKWPTLSEAYLHYTGQEIEGAHDALVDAEACLAIFRGLVQEGVVELTGH